MAHESNIMIRQMYDVFGMRKQSHKIYLGDLSKELTMELCTTLEKTLDKHSAKSSYNIMIHTRFDPVGKRTFKTVIFILPGNADMNQYKTLGTMAFHVDNKRGAFKKLWILPMDRPVIEGITTMGNPVPGMYEDAKDMPVKGLVLSSR